VERPHELGLVQALLERGEQGSVSPGLRAQLRRAFSARELRINCDSVGRRSIGGARADERLQGGLWLQVRI
jgi:hypothetical protein